MATTKIYLYPHPLLGTRSTEVSDFGEGLRRLADVLMGVVKEKKAVGISAVQIGVPQRVMVVGGHQDQHRVMVNPTLDSYVNEFAPGEEGCLSVPGVQLPIPRYKKVSVSYQDLAGERHSAILEDLESRCFQHELEHLDGKIFLSKTPDGFHDAVIKQISLQVRSAHYKAIRKNYTIPHTFVRL